MTPDFLLNDRWSIEHAIAEGFSDEEIVDELLSYDSPVFIDGTWYGPPRQGVPASENRRLMLAMLGEIRREMGEAGAPASQRGADAAPEQRPPVEGRERRPGPRPATTREEVDAKRAELTSDLGRPPGERMIADALGVTRDAVRYALGKDRRRKRR